MKTKNVTVVKQILINSIKNYFSDCFGNHYVSGIFGSMLQRQKSLKRWIFSWHFFHADDNQRVIK